MYPKQRKKKRAAFTNSKGSLSCPASTHYELIRSRRRTTSLEVSRDGRLIVRAPLRAPVHLIEEIVDRHSDWIEKKRKKASQWEEKYPEKTFHEGERFMYLGDEYRLRFVNEGRTCFTPGGDFLLSSAGTGEVRDAILQWYREEAQKVLSGRVVHFADIFKQGNIIPRVRISGARKRWGSCGLQGSLNFTWRLVMLPEELIDYVVVHELAHLVVPNHSKKFWKKVGEILPDYRQRRNRLKEYEPLLVIL